MARFTDEIAQSLESNFQRRVPSYMSEDVQLTAYEQDPVGTGNIQPVGFIADGAIDDLVLFADTIRPPEVLAALPALPDATYPVGALVFLTTDAKLYRNTDGSTWSVAVDGADIIANSITAGQIAAGAIGTTELAASAVIANVANVGSTVVIDSTGITITDGALTFADASGVTVLDQFGFGATWLDFLSSLVYNGRFTAGSTTGITANTEVGTGNTTADYQASISPDLPYWVIRAQGGGGTLQRVSDSNAPSGYALRVQGNETVTIYQDVPINPGQQYAIYLLWRYSNSTSGFSMDVGAQFLDSDHGVITSVSEISQSLAYSTTEAAYISQYMITSNVSTTKARYLRVRVSPTRTSGSGTNPSIYIAAVVVQPVIQYGNTYIREGTLTMDGDYGIGWWDGVTVDTVIEYVAGSSGIVHLYRPLGFGLGGSLWIDNDNGTNLSSTNHGLTVGPNSGLNVVISHDEIMARDNGAAGTLKLNRLGGAVWMGANANFLNDNLNMDAGFIQLTEITAPSAGNANTGRLFLRDNGAGKTQLCIRFNTGAIQVISTQP